MFVTAQDQDVYDALDRDVNRVPATALGFTQLVAARGYQLDESFVTEAQRRHRLIQEFFAAATDVLAAALDGDLPPNIARLLLNETPDIYGADFHRRVLARRRTIPQFFRTDEVLPGRIVEIQSPGSQWGEYEAVRDVQLDRDGRFAPSLADCFVSQITHAIGDRPRIHHLVDNASAPHTVRYFIERTRPLAQYFGIDSGVDQMSCNFVRSHSFFGQAAENFFAPRLDRYLAGELAYDLPPLIIFDEKITLALPFLPETAGAFSDDIRSILVHSSVLSPEGFILPDGEPVTLEQFASMGRAERAWFGKYAGSDVSINWGSRAVRRLDNMSKERCLAFLKQHAEGGRVGKFWIMQPLEAIHENVEFADREGDLATQRCTVKYSGFHGPGGYMGTLVMHRNFYKVHGQDDTVLSVGIPPTQTRLDSL